MATNELTRPQTHYPLTELNIPGAYTTPAPPDDFDPRTALPSALVKDGLLWRRPEEGDHPSLLSALEAALSRRWLAKDRIIPHLEPQPGKTHLLRGLRRVETGFTSNSWSGGIFQGAGNWVTAIGNWVIPTVSQPNEPQGLEGGWNSSSWVGIDGFNSNDVLQAGIQQRVDSGGNPSYVAWYEWFVSAPAPPCPDPTGCDSNGYPLSWVGPQGSFRYIYQTNIPNFPVSPGQTVSCSIQYANNKTTGLIAFGNNTTGQHFSITLLPPPGAAFSGNCVEWIMEAPDLGEPISALPRFTPVTFRNALGCTLNAQTIANPQNGDFINIQNGGQTLTSVTLGNDTVTINFIG
jgi:hypothetical protein